MRLTYKWHSSTAISKIQLSTLGLTIGVVGQGECLVVEDSQQRVFVIRGGERGSDGFVSYGAEGMYRILATVDSTNLGQENAVLEKHTKNGEKARIVGWKKTIISDTVRYPPH
jgi:hypothetical protein